MLNGVFLFAALIRAQRRVSTTSNALRIQRRIWVAKRRTIFWYSSGGAVPPICPSGTRVRMHVCGQNNKLLAELLESDGTQDTRNHRVRGHDLTQCLDDLADNFGHVAYRLNFHLFVIGKNLMSFLDALSVYLCASSTTHSLDARIKAYRRHLASSNLTSADRVTLTQSLTFHLRERYKILEEVDDDSDLLYPP